MNDRHAIAVTAAFSAEHDFARAFRAMHERHGGRVEAYTPVPVPGLDECLGARRSPLPTIMGLAAIVGGSLAFGGQTFAMVKHLPLVVAGRPYFSWPAFLPITFELSVLFGAFVGLFSWFIILKLPRLYQPVLGSPLVRRASQDRFVFQVEGLPSQDAARELESSLQTEFGADETEIVER